MKSVNAVDYLVIAAYMALMLGIGFYSARFNKGASDYFKGSNRIPWLVAGLSSFMSGFSAWTFTGAAGLAYQHGLVAILLYLGNAVTFLIGYWVFAVRWRRARISTVMEYLVERFDEDWWRNPRAAGHLAAILAERRLPPAEARPAGNTAARHLVSKLEGGG